MISGTRAPHGVEVICNVVGLADLIVDVVETGSTLKENGLVEHELIAEISSVVVANRSLFKLRHAEVSAIVEKLRSVIST